MWLYGRLHSSPNTSVTIGAWHTPMPSVKRPPLIWLTVRACWARCWGSVDWMAITPVANSMRGTRSATTANTAIGSARSTWATM